jgi:FkbM family methyltransferase
MLRTVNGRWGTATYFSKDEYVGRSLHNYGEYNPDETEMILSLANRTCLDIGANIGVIAQALEYSGFHTIAFEPQTEVFNVLSKNFGGEKHNCAVGSEQGTVIMPKMHYSEKGNFGGISVNTRSHLGMYKVPMVSIDYMVNDLDIGFMKIDVEGFELEVLKGAVQTIERCKPILYVEDDRMEKSRALREFIKKLGYSIEEHKPTLYREDNFFGLKKNVWDRNYASHNIICKPC